MTDNLKCKEQLQFDINCLSDDIKLNNKIAIGYHLAVMRKLIK